MLAYLANPTVLSGLSWISDFACIAFAAWTFPALYRVITGRAFKFSDPLAVLALLLVSGRYAFVAVKWLFGAHRDLLSHAEVVGRDIAYVWSLLTLAAAVVVIRGYKAMGR